MNLPPGLLLDGTNTLTLTAQGGPYDTSLVDYVRIDYPHSYVADSDKLKFTGRAGAELKIAGFENPLRRCLISRIRISRWHSRRKF